MVYEFKFPDIGEGIHEGQLVKWLVKEGDLIKEEQSMAEVETDKAIVEVPSPASGIILKLHVKAGDIIKVGQVIITIGQKDENVDKKTITDQIISEKKVKAEGIIATLKVRKLAEGLGVDLTKVKATGFSGAITEDDVTNYLNQLNKRGAESSYSKFGNITEIEMSHLRKMISEKMSLSKHTASHSTHFDEADATNLMVLRNNDKIIAEKKKVHLTFLPYIIKAAVLSLIKHPYINSSLDQESEKIVLKKFYNIGIAVDTDDGLIVPNIKNVDKLDLFELAKDISEISEKARTRKINLDDLKGGSFSITNIGSIGGKYIAPIVNYPEVAILGVGKIRKMPRVINDKIEIRQILPLSLSFDHRVVDGAEAARFVNDLIAAIENPEMLKNN